MMKRSEFKRMLHAIVTEDAKIRSNAAEALMGMEYMPEDSAEAAVLEMIMPRNMGNMNIGISDIAQKMLSNIDSVGSIDVFNIHTMLHRDECNNIRMAMSMGWEIKVEDPTPAMAFTPFDPEDDDEGI
jgi:hypothetical protein